MDTDVLAHALLTFGASHTCSSLEEISLDQLRRGFSLAFGCSRAYSPGVGVEMGPADVVEQRRNRVPREGSIMAVYQ